MTADPPRALGDPNLAESASNAEASSSEYDSKQFFLFFDELSGEWYPKRSFLTGAQ